MEYGKRWDMRPLVYGFAEGSDFHPTEDKMSSGSYDATLSRVFSDRQRFKMGVVKQVALTFPD
ncbi:hypothetical protein GCM10027578_26890 [Spirosoma luteolum]